MKNIYPKLTAITIQTAIAFISASAYGQTASATIDVNTIVMQNPKLLLGITYDCRSSLSDPVNGLTGYHNTDGSFIAEVDSIFNDFPMSSLRYPANGIMQGFEWKKSIGKIPSRTPQKIFASPSTPAQVLEFGFDEFMAMTAARGVDPKDVQIMMPIYDSADVTLKPVQLQAAIPDVVRSNADWVEYCNAPSDGSNPGGGVDWAAVRDSNGHHLPYGIKIWNMGNEPYTLYEYDAAGVANYISAIVPIIDSMLAIDSTIKITVTVTAKTSLGNWTDVILNSPLLQGKIYGVNNHFFLTENVVGAAIPQGVAAAESKLKGVAAAAAAKGYKLIVGDQSSAIVPSAGNPTQAEQDLAMQWQGANLTADFLLMMSQVSNIERSDFWVYGLTATQWHPIRKNANGTFTLMPAAVLYKTLSPVFLDNSLAVVSSSPVGSDGNTYSVRSSAFASTDKSLINVVSVNRDKVDIHTLQINGISSYNLLNSRMLTASSLASDTIIESAISADTSGLFTLPPMSMLVLEYSLDTTGVQHPPPASVPVTMGNINRATPKFGFNTNAHVPQNFPVPGNSGANWNQQWFIDSVGVLNPEILRFPGGTNSNHWDWQTGWFVPAYAPASSPQVLRTDEFKPGLMACNGVGLFVVNLETSNVQHEMDGLRHAASIGLNPTLIELGNEHNLDGDTTYPAQLMTPAAYGQLAKTYYDSIKVEFPNSKVCLVGGNSQPLGINPTWNTDVLNLVPSSEALAFHVYLNANNADLVFNVNRALANPFGNFANHSSLDYRYNVSGFGNLPAGKEVWVTEFNLEEKQVATNYVISQTWTHTLFITAMNHYFLMQPNITMILNHSLASSVSHYESISKLDGHFTANALAMSLLYDVARGSQTCQDLAFAGNPSMTYLSATIPKLIGWKFNHTGIEKGFICNFSADTFNLSFSSVFNQNMQFDQYSADTAFVVKGRSSLTKYSGNSVDSIIIYPFSITQIQTVPDQFTWTGAASKDWFSSANWSGGVVPDQSSDVTIDDVSGASNNFPEIFGPAVAQANNIIMAGNSSLAVFDSSNGQLEIYGDVSCTGTLAGEGTINFKGASSTVSGTLRFSGLISVSSGSTLNTGGNLILADGGSLLHGTGTPGGDGNVNGAVTVERIGTSINSAYNFWASPVQNSNVSILGQSRYYYNPQNALDLSESGLRQGWVSASGTMTNGLGYISKGGGTVSFSGVPNNAPVGNNISVTVTKNAGIINNVGYNLIGNPFPSSLDANAFLAVNGPAGSGVLAGALYFWDDDNSGGSGWTTQDYAVWSGAGFVGTNSGINFTGHIASCQSFFVDKINDGSASVDFKNSMRSTVNDAFFKMAPIERFWISIINPNQEYNETLIALIDDATDGVDLMYDAKKIKGNAFISIYSKIDTEDYAIQALPLLDEDRVIPIGFDAATTGMHTIALKLEENLDESVVIMLEDRELGIYQNLGVQPSYSFNSVAGSNRQRFFLHLNPPLLLETQPAGCTGENGAFVIEQRGNKHWNYILMDDSGNQIRSAYDFHGMDWVDSIPAGKYLLTLTDTFGYQFLQEMEIDHPEPVFADFQMNTSVALAGEEINFENTSTGATDFYWNFGDGSYTTATGPLIHTFQSAGIYPVILTASNEHCADETTRQVDISVATFTGDLFDENTLTIFPNPSNGRFIITFPGEISHPEIYMISAEGKTVFHEHLLTTGKGQKEISLQGLPAGVYFLKVRNERIQVIHKVVVYGSDLD